MNENRKKIIYLCIIIFLAVAFVILYSTDKTNQDSKSQIAFSDIFQTIEPAFSANNDNQNRSSSDNINNETNNETNNDDEVDEAIPYNKFEKVQVINWDEAQVDSIRVSNPRNKFTLTRHGYRKWMINSVRIDAKVPRANRAIFRILNIFKHFFADYSLTRDYSELSEHFEKPICTVLVYFKDGTVEKLTFIRIEEYNEIFKEYKLKTWVRINEETVVYSTVFNTLERFLVSENEFLKLY